MEPQLPKPQFSPERAPTVAPNPQGNEVHSPQMYVEASPILEQGRESKEAVQGGPSQDGTIPPVSTPPALPVLSPVAANDPMGQTDDSTPSTAADDDLIEKEWVDKAKKVVAETRNDPHAQDLAIGRLQADYLKKRYGKVVSLPADR